ncbi:hypothetical protein HJ590_02030 [Naumannella sp. ID2617S]|nr:hypothetical protein [Naumannella sp. ID2617S]
MQIEEITPSLIDGRPHPGLVDVVDLWRRWGEAVLGHDDFQHGPLGLAHQLRELPSVRQRLFVARDGKRVVGSIQLGLSLTDNLHLADLEPCVDPNADPAAVLGTLWSELQPVLSAEGRTAVSVWTTSSLETGPDPLTPVTGSGRVQRDATADWLLDNGFLLDQVERAGLLRLDGSPDFVAQLSDAEPHSAAYHLVQWKGITPEPLREPMAMLRGRMSTDVPKGDLPMEAERWDAERVLALDSRHADGGQTDLWTVAVHSDTGEPVAHTYLGMPQEKPEVAWQEDTLVRPDHRGHRLGMRIKAANLLQLRAGHPAVRRVRTWNADENAPMLAINDALGFRPDAVEGLWVWRA